MASDKTRFYEVLTEAVNDLVLHGFDSQQRIDMWLQRLREAARVTLVPPEVLERALKDALVRVYQRTVDGGKLAKMHADLSEFTLSQIKPKLRDELDRRILASASLIKLNREASIQRTLQRFAGWATSIPKGGTEVQKRSEVAKEVRRGIAGLPFEERRVVIDQGHKLVSAINDIVARDGGAIAAIWHSHWREAGYNFREEHKQRDRHLYVVRNNWALESGFMKLGGSQYTDEISEPGYEIYCRCYYQYVYNLRDLPVIMLTNKGKAALAQARERLAG